MSSRITEKERRRQEREQAAERAARRARLGSAGITGFIGLLAVSGITNLFAFSGGEGNTFQDAAPGPFGQHYKLHLRERQRIVISYGDKDAPAPDGIER